MYRTITALLPGVAMHEYIQMPAPANVVYVVYWVLCAGYAAFSLAASILAPQHRQRIHRGSWLHVAEGWALVAVLWAAGAWARYVVLASATSWSGAGPTPPRVSVATVAFWVILPAALTALFVMVVTTVVRAWPQRRATAV
jgi:hypothetical protein